MQIGNVVTFEKAHQNMNRDLKMLRGQDGKVSALGQGAAENRVLVEFNSQQRWWIAKKYLRVRIPCYLIPHVYNSNGVCFHCGSQKEGSHE